MPLEWWKKLVSSRARTSRTGSLIGAALVIVSCSTAATGPVALPEDATDGDVAHSIPMADAASLDAGRDVSADARDGGGSAGAGALDVPSSNGVWQMTEDVSLAGSGTVDLGTIAISHGVGSISFRGESASAFVYQAVATPTGASDDAGVFAADTDFEIVAASGSRVILAWITCTADHLTYVYYETTDGFSSDEEIVASGTCAVSTSAVSESVALPALELSPPAVVPGFTISGASVSYDGATPGSATFEGASWSLYPFHEIDCSTCATPGWFELHSLFWQPGNQTACLGILYLEASAPATVELAYFICLPSVGDPIGEELTYPATWTTP